MQLFQAESVGTVQSSSSFTGRPAICLSAPTVRDVLYTGRGQFGYLLALYTSQYSTLYFFLFFFFTDFQHVTTKSSLIFNCLMSVTVSGPSTVLFFDTSSSQAAAVSLPADGHKSCFGFIQRLECVIFSRESS